MINVINVNGIKNLPDILMAETSKRRDYCNEVQAQVD
jgi:hypothetical protein